LKPTSRFEDPIYEADVASRVAPLVSTPGESREEK